MLLSRWMPWCAVVICLPLAGCGGSSLPEGAYPTEPVTVTVTYNGQPVEGATITFINEKAPAYGLTDAQGVARMKTYGEADGAVAGTHKVTIIKTEISGGAPVADQDSAEYVPPEMATSAPPVTIKHFVPEKYNSPATTDLTAEVDGAEEIRFDLKD